MADVIKALIASWRSLPFPRRRWRVVGRVTAGDEVPDHIPDKGAVLVGSEGAVTWLAFDCPCQTRHRLMVNLDSSRFPSWKIESLNPLSLRPSIHNITPEVSCHFVLSGGRIRWIQHTWRQTE